MLSLKSLNKSMRCNRECTENLIKLAIGKSLKVKK